MAVGIFDSGFGGLTVVRQLVKLFPGVNLIYFGDAGRVPYGDKSKEQIVEFNEEIIAFLIEKGVRVILMGCNTSSSLAIERDKKIFAVPIFGLIDPVARKINEISHGKRVGVLATVATVNSGAYTKKIKKYHPEVAVFEIACPKLVPLVESGKFEGVEVETALSEYLKPLLEKGVDVLIYGCTHYPFLEGTLKKLSAGRFNLVDPAYYICQEAAATLQRLPTGRRPQRLFYTTGSAEKFRQVSQRLVSDIIAEAEIFPVTLAELKSARERFFQHKGKQNVSIDG